MHTTWVIDAESDGVDKRIGVDLHGRMVAAVDVDGSFRHGGDRGVPVVACARAG